jgi:peptidoglycan/xylan/chitin deacetylase (PgdA/CDA1 family)
MSAGVLAAGAWQAGLSTLARARAGEPLSVLIFHRVMETPDELQPGEPTAREFEARLAWVGSCFNVIPLAEAVAGLRAGRLPRRALAITFDDGYRDNAELAAPILAKLGLPATFFVATGFLDGGRMFNDTVIEAVRRNRHLDLSDLGLGVHALAAGAEKRAAIGKILAQVKYRALRERDAITAQIAARAGAPLPDDLMMQSGQVAQLKRAGFEIGGHTVNHPILAELDAAQARREIDEGRRRLEQITAAPVRLFAYPNGRPVQDYRREHVDLVRELGFVGAVSTARGAARPGADVFQIPRFTPWDRPNWRFGMRLARNYFETVQCAVN